MRRWLPFYVVAMQLCVASSASAEPTEPGTLVNPLAVANTCDYCHTFGNDDAHLEDPPFAPFPGWQGSMMANSARDPVFWAGVAVADADHPEEVVDCIRCHVPRAFLENRADTINSVDDLGPDDREGIMCELCHRMTDQGAIGNGQYNIDDTLVGLTVARRGPFDYTDGVPQPSEMHATIADPFTGTSALCGTCHDVTTPRSRVDDDGQALGVSFNEQRTYSEWLGSAFAQEGEGFRSCIDCHMPEVPDTSACRDYVDTQAHPTGNRRHELLGANRFMLQLLRDNFGGEALPVYFDLAIERLDEFVRTAATLDVTAPDEVDLTVGIEGIEVVVTNESGHKLPTGYSEGRVMWIELTATYDGIPVWSSGYWDAGTRELQQDDQLRTYQGVAEELASGTTFHLLRNDHWVEDTRIPPRGLLPNIETDPVGDRYTLQKDGTWPNFDTHTYAFGPRNDITDATEEDILDVRVRLLYLINTPEYIDFLAAESDAGQEVAAMFDASGGATPVELAVVDLQIPIVGFGGAEGSGSSTSGETGDPPTTSTPTSSSTSPTTDPTVGDTDADETTANADDGGNGGCSCRSEPSPRDTGWLLLLLFAATSRARRDRSGPVRWRTTRSR
jgi:MYXO-CTERM domain-containing protein